MLTLAFSVGAKAEIINHKLQNQLIRTYAHNVEISEDIACTFHISPNHNPKVGKSSVVWFALTRKGGKSIPFNECNCQLNVYAEPRNSNSKPIMNPKLKGINTEQHQDIPGTEIIPDQFTQAHQGLRKSILSKRCIRFFHGLIEFLLNPFHCKLIPFRSRLIYNLPAFQ